MSRIMFVSQGAISASPCCTRSCISIFLEQFPCPVDDVRREPERRAGCGEQLHVECGLCFAFLNLLLRELILCCVMLGLEG
jgi:hypothetical protein